MKHLCVDARLIVSAGIGTYLRAALQHLSRDPRFQLTLLCREEDREALTAFSSRLIPFSSPIYSAAEQIEYLKKIPHCDLFWTPHFNVPLGPIRAKKRLSSVHDVYHLAHLRQFSLKEKLYAQVVYNAAFLLSDTVFTLSEFSKQEITRLATFKPKRLLIVPSLPPFPSYPVQARQKFILFVGNLKPHKNLLRLLKAYEELRPGIPLYLVGKKEGMRHVESMIFQEIEKSSFLKQNVHLMGSVSEEKLRQLYATAHLFVFPSTYEGYGYPPLEAMAAGCPVVASQAAAIPEVCGEAVEYADPVSIPSLIAAMKRVLDNTQRREELIQKGYDLIEAKKKTPNPIADVIHACCCNS